MGLGNMSAADEMEHASQAVKPSASNPMGDLVRAPMHTWTPDELDCSSNALADLINGPGHMSTPDDTEHCIRKDAVLSEEALARRARMGSPLAKYVQYFSWSRSRSQVRNRIIS